MNIEQMTERYGFARTDAIREIEDLHAGADSERVFEAVETALLWKIMLMTQGQLAIHPDTLGEMLEATDPGDSPAFRREDRPEGSL